MNFSLFSKIEMCIDFQGTSFVLLFFPDKKDSTIHGFSFNSYNANDNKCRLIIGKFKFAGRYITEIGCVMSYDLDPFAQLDSTKIYVTKIVGFK